MLAAWPCTGSKHQHEVQRRKGVKAGTQRLFHVPLDIVLLQHLFIVVITCLVSPARWCASYGEILGLAHLCSPWHMWALFCSFDGVPLETVGFTGSPTKSWSLSTLFSVLGGLMDDSLLWVIKATTQLFCLLKKKTSFSFVLALTG